MLTESPQRGQFSGSVAYQHVRRNCINFLCRVCTKLYFFVSQNYLAHDYNNVLLHHTSSRSKHCNQYGSYFINWKKRKQEEEKKEEELTDIEDMIIVLLWLQNRRRGLDAVGKPCASRKGMKYERNTLYFTNPETGI